MLRRLAIKGYKSLADVELTLGELCVLFGPNAAGKSNLLDALQLIGRLVSSRNLNEAFDSQYRGTPLESFTFPADGIPGLLARGSAEFSIEVDVELSEAVITRVSQRIQEMKRSHAVREDAEAYGESKKPGPIRERYLRYRLKVEVLPKSGILRVTDEYLAALNDKGEPRSGRRPFLERVDGRLHLRMEGQAHPIYFDLHLDHTVLSKPHYPPHYPHLSALRDELASWCFFYFEPREQMRKPNPVKEVRHIGLMGEDLAAFLNTLRATEEGQFKALERALKQVIPSVTGIDVAPNNIGEVELRIREGDMAVPARVVSEGTLRVLGLLSLQAVSDPMALVGFEEPENGVHPRRIRLIAEILRTFVKAGQTQLIVTTHSPLLPDLLPPQCLYVCRRKGGRTEIEPFTTWGDLAKRPKIEQALDDLPPVGGGELPVSGRVLRGDFDV